MVARWRERLGPGRAYFVALDTLTNRAHRELFNDGDRLVVNPEAWLMLVVNIATDDPAQSVDAAELVADAIVRETVMALATGHTLEEALEIAAVLCAAGEMPSSRELRDLESPTLLDHVDALIAEGESPLATRAAAVLQRRASRATRRALRLEEESKGAVRTAKSRADNAEERNRQLEGTNRSLSQDLENERSRAARAESVSRRVTLAWVAALLGGLCAVALVVGGWIAGRGIGIVAVIVGLWGLYAWQWVESERSGSSLFRGFAIEILLVVLSGLIS